MSDRAPGDGAGAPAPVAERAPGPLTAAVDEALAALAGPAHCGLRHPSGAALTRIEEAATALRRTGLKRAAALVRTVLSAPADATAAPAARLDARLHLLVGSELLAVEGRPHVRQLPLRVIKYDEPFGSRG
ncbi:hypothetical protein [Streptomyces sp. NPDC019224]|uniref:hypothetical protein n=1 Tax=Streptomyces sp. NPDC019224 TaxID=3154484 RepID=UPI0033E9DADD